VADFLLRFPLRDVRVPMLIGAAVLVLVLPACASPGSTAVVPIAPPANDAFSARIALDGRSGTASGTNVGATSEAGEPNHRPSSSQSVWWTWTAPTAGAVAFNTFGSTFDTVLAVYVGNSVGTLTSIVSNDDSSGVLQSRVAFFASSGTSYHIAVDGFGAASGAVSLAWGPANDDFSQASVLPPSSGTTTGWNDGATTEGAEPAHAGSGPHRSVWWSWTAPSSGTASFDTAGSAFDTVLAVYTGVVVSGLTSIGSNDDSGGLQSRVEFQAVAGTTYAIAVGGFSTETVGPITLSWSRGSTSGGGGGGAGD
jgi:hypothetical protein